MKKTLLIIGLIGIMGIMSACEAADPIDDIYTSNILVGNSGGNVGEIDRPYDAGYFDNIETGSIETTDIETESLTLDGVDMSAHASTHEWGGSDEIDIKSSMIFPFTAAWYGFGDTTQWTYTSSGGACYGSVGYTTVINYVDAVQWHAQGVIISSGIWHSSGHNIKTAFTLQCSSINDVDLWAGYYASNNWPYPSANSTHYGIHVIDNNVYASTGNGTHGNETLITGLGGAWWELSVGLEYTGSEIRYYLSEVLEATHTSYLPVPSGADLYNGVWLQNTATAEKYLVYKGLRILRE